MNSRNILLNQWRLICYTAVAAAVTKFKNAIGTRVNLIIFIC